MKSKIIFTFLLLLFAFFSNSQTLMNTRAFPINLSQPIDTTPINFGNAILGGASASIQNMGDNTDIRLLPSSSNWQSEVHISINRANPNILLASANTYNPSSGNHNQGYYYSTDGGNTWYGKDALQGSPAQVGGDPSTAISANGKMYISTIAPNVRGYLIQNSTNNGTSFPYFITNSTSPDTLDKEMIAVDDQPGSPYVNNNVYCAWTTFNGPIINIELNRSTDGGNNFSAPIILKNSNGWGQGANVQTGPNGEVYVCWADYNPGSVTAAGLGFVSSIANGGTNFTAAQRVFTYNGIRSGNAPVPAFGNIRINDFPSMAVDKSNSKIRGRIYVVYPEFDANQHSIIRVRSSGDKGVTWSSPVTVSIPNATQSFFPWITVDQYRGDILVTYYAFDNPSSIYSTNTYVARSSDGGNTWENLQVSDVPHITAPIVPLNNNIFEPGYAGDYIGIAAYGGMAYPAWMDNRTGIWQIYVSPLNYISSISGDAAICSTSNLYTISNLPTNATVTWSASPSGIVTINSPGAQQTTLTKTGNGAVTITATVSNNYEVYTLQKSIFIGTPIITGITGYATVRAGGSIPYSCNGSGIESVTWSSTGNSITKPTIETNGTDVANITFMYNGTYTITAQATNQCGSSTYKLAVTVTGGYDGNNPSCPTCPSVGLYDIGITPNPASSILNVNVTNDSSRLNTASSNNGTVAMISTAKKVSAATLQGTQLSNRVTDNTGKVIAISTANKQEDKAVIMTIQIVDQSGKVRKSLKYSAAKQAKVDVSNLPNGVYFMNISNGETTVQKKIIVQH
ncbi:MAG: T9SS type A sorting domain-containing protein [Chitinophagaceae bacterium]|jgi:hypothetical protein|nr:T9SS type A sorting domain-containing protein [Chitinophagaceae bacterium]